VRLAKALSAAGRICITAGVLILLFVAYQLWGTGIREAQAQDRLERQFKQKLAELDSASTDTAATSVLPSTASGPPETLPVVTAPPGPELVEGEVMGRIEIPKIGLDAYIIEGVSVDDLKSGPGHYPSTPAPGQKGNAAIAGHRTTYGAPFGSVDELEPGDAVMVTTQQGKFTYAVTGQRIVNPNQTEVLDDAAHDNRLTLTACHPKYSASERIIISAALQGEPKPAPPRPANTPAPQLSDESLSGKKAPKLPAIAYGLLCATIWIAAWQFGNRWRKWPAYFIGLPFFLVALFYFFENFSRLLPSNY
jgi:sortase A